MASKTLNTKIVLRNDTTTNWTTKNPVLSTGELGIETNTRKIKIGDGTTAWNTLSYMDGGGVPPAIIADYTLSAANWDNNSYTLSITGKTALNNALVSNSNTGTDSQVLENSIAIADANIYKITDNGTSLTFVCQNTPTTDLKIQVEVYE